MTTELRTFDCPRCATSVTEPYYGPCTSCRTELRERCTATAREVATTAYVPKMNVVANQVATKD